MSKKITTIVKTACAAGILLATSGVVFAEEGDVKTTFYGSIRMGVDYVDAGTDDDAANGRDFLSRIGTKSSLDLGNGLTGLVNAEYGLRGDDNVNFVQNQKPGLRVLQVGLKGDFGTVLFGSGTTLWHKYVRGAYFSDGLDSLRQGAIRDDDMLEWQKTYGNWKFGASVQMESQDGDAFDQTTFATEYKVGAVKLQAAISSDNRGANTGNLLGLRGWYTVSDAVTLSAFYHLADDDYDFYGYGNSSGNVRIVGGSTVGNLGGTGAACNGEERSTAGLYGKWKSGKNTFQARYAVNACDIKGDVESVKVEYIRSLGKKYKGWISFEQLTNDATRMPSNGEEQSEFQVGVQVDF